MISKELTNNITDADSQFTSYYQNESVLNLEFGKK